MKKIILISLLYIIPDFMLSACDNCIMELQNRLDETKYWIRVYEQDIQNALDVETFIYLQGIQAGQKEALEIMIKQHYSKFL